MISDGLAYGKQARAVLGRLTMDIHHCIVPATSCTYHRHVCFSGAAVGRDRTVLPSPTSAHLRPLPPGQLDSHRDRLGYRQLLPTARVTFIAGVRGGTIRRRREMRETGMDDRDSNDGRGCLPRGTESGNRDIEAI